MGTEDQIYTSQAFNSLNDSINFATALGSLGATIDLTHYSQKVEESTGTIGSGPIEGGPSNEDLDRPIQNPYVDDDLVIMEASRGEYNVVGVA